MFLFLLTSCVGPSTAPDLHMAENGQWTFNPDHFCEAINCRFDEVDEILDVIPEVDGVVDVVSIDPTLFTLQGLVVGDTLLSISGFDKGSNLVERYVHIHVAPIYQFTLSPRCEAMQPSDDPWVLPVGSEVYAKWKIRDTDYNELLAFPELESSGITQSDQNLDLNSVVLTMPDQAGVVDVTSFLTTDPVAQFQVVTEEQYDGFEAYFLTDSPMTVGDSRRMDTAVLVEGKRVCIDTVERVITVLTPDVCGFYLNEEPVLEIIGSDEHIDLIAVAEGTCEVEVAVPSLEWSETLTLAVEDAE